MVQELSPRELELLEWAAAGLLYKQMAVRLGRSESTIKTHFVNIRGKLGATDKANAVALAMARGLLKFKEKEV